MPKSRFFSVFQTLASHRVDFIVVGGVAAVLRGAPVSTFDLDVVHSTAPENIGRGLAALEDLDACYRAQPERRLRPDTTHHCCPANDLRPADKPFFLRELHGNLACRDLNGNWS